MLQPVVVEVLEENVQIQLANGYFNRTKSYLVKISAVNQLKYLIVINLMLNVIVNSQLIAN